MSPRVRSVCVFVLLFGRVLSVTLNTQTHNNIVADSRLELTANYISCGLNDILTISAPFVNHNVSIYQLTKPNGDTRRLHITQTRDSFMTDSDENSVVVKYNREKDKVMTLLNNYKLSNVNLGMSIGHDSDLFERNLAAMKENEFIIGPLAEDDHGNWVLSMFAKENGKWLEIFQVITVQIKGEERIVSGVRTGTGKEVYPQMRFFVGVDYLPPKEELKTLKKGDTFSFGFAYPIPDLKSCEFTAPKGTFDRWYDRDQANLDHCMFVVNNVTKVDEGLWMVVGVGRIVYITQTFLNVS